RDVHLDPRGPDAQIVGVDRGHEQVVQPIVEREFSAPALDAWDNLLVRARVVIDRALEQQLRLVLRGHRIERPNFVLRQHIGGRRLGLSRKAEEMEDLLPAGASGAGADQEYWRPTTNTK